MRRLPTKLIAPLIATLALGTLMGCQQSPRKQFYLLSATESTYQSGKISQSVGLGPIEVADYLQRSQLIINRDPNSVQLATNAYWGEPVKEGIIRVLSLNLMNHQPARLVEAFPWRSDNKPAISIRLQVHELQVMNGNAVMNASWKLVDHLSEKNLAQYHYQGKVASGNDPAEIANAYSMLLKELADEMNNALNASN